MAAKSSKNKARKKKVKPPSRLKGADVSSTDDDASSYTSNATTSRRSTPSASFRSAPSDADGAKQGKRGGSKEAGDWLWTSARDGSPLTRDAGGSRLIAFSERHFEGKKIGVNLLIDGSPVPPAGGVAFHDTAIWLKAEASEVVLDAAD